MANMKDELKRLLNVSNPTTEEKKRLLQYLNDTDGGDLKELMEQYFAQDNSNTIDSDISNKVLQNIHEKIGYVQEVQKSKSFKIGFIVRLVAAACIIGILISVVYFYFNGHNQKDVAKNEQGKGYKNGIAANTNKVELTLADGSVIVLDSVKNGSLTKQGNTQVIKLNDKLLYGASDTANKAVVYNTISTLRGGRYQIELPDGSQVWLNAESSLRFPTAFTGKERKVEITGEAYFEVAKNKAMPFIVKVNDAEVQVLGTHFDIMAYKDEPYVNTTLLEGSVRFVNNGTTNILKPGQQSQLTKEDNSIAVLDNVDVENVMAWKNGLFRFRGEDIGVVLRQLTRWYDVQIVYGGNINDLFYAEIPQNTALPEVLKALELTGKVHFKTEGKKIIVLP